MPSAGCASRLPVSRTGLGLALACIALQLCAATAHAGGPHALYIVDANTGAPLQQQAASEPRYPASLTKMMTLYMAFEAIDAGRASLKTRIKISQQAANAAPSKLDLAVGDDISLEDAIMALITKSANDVAIAVAEHLGGTEANFARLMTAKARDLGMANTTFKNASGLPDSGQTTTAKDMVTLGLRLHDDHPRFFPLFATRSFAYNGGTFKNHNTLMLQMPGINGIKTGYTHASGFNLVSSLQQDGKHIIGAIFGGETAGSRNAMMKVALSRAFAKASAVKTRVPVLVARAQADKREAAAKAAKVAQRTTVAAAAARSLQVQAPAVPTASPAESAPQPPVAPAGVADSPPVRTAQAKVEIAKVRTVDVSSVESRPAKPNPPAPPAFAQASAYPALAPPPAPEVPQARPAPVAAGASPTPDTSRLPSSFEQQMASMAQNMSPAGTVAPTPAPLAPPPAAATTVAQPAPTARPPSSLGAQMAQLIQASQPASTPMAQPSRLRGPETAPAASPAPAASGGYAIQIGAYASPAEADRRLTAAQSQIALLRDRQAQRQAVTTGDKTLYRARFLGFDATSAQSACAELARQSLNCLALKAD
jgi:D-alanyl-D-alanine carboxypeptidase